ncbi:non-canonical purine NTP pyrophosphatase [Akkermansia sp.]
MFVPEGHELSFAQLPMEVKNSMSHRARALAQVVEWMKECRD